ncbi:MAG: NosD domain-containing protein [Candidatus Thorarchaeota archaeon]
MTEPIESETILVQESCTTLAYSSHAPITITSNSDFEAQSWPGDGTSGNPYLIRSLNITSETAVCILIANTTSYFTISECWFSAQDSEWGLGIITMENVVHARVDSNIFASGHIAISVEDSSSCSITRNEIGTSLMGFLANNLNNSEFSNNTQISESMGYPVHIQNGNNIYIRWNLFQNSVYEGIGLTSSTNCYLEFNDLSGGDLHAGQYGFAIRDSLLCYVRENNVTGCGTAIDVTGGQSLEITDNVIILCWGGVMVRGNETIISGNDIRVMGFCIQLRGSFDCVVQSNYLQSTILSIGIDVNGGGFSSITDNVLHRHEFGIRLQGVENLTISENEFSYCFLAITFEEVAYFGLEDGPPINCRIINNDFEACSIRFSISDPASMNHEIVGNLVNGRELAYIYEATNQIIDGRDYGQIILAACDEISINGGVLDELTIMFSSNCEVTGVTIENRTNGIYIRYSNQIIVGYSEVSGNEVGVRVEWSSFCNIIQTTAYNNRHGVYLDSSPNATVYDCDLFENDYGMVLIGAHDSHIESNRVHNNEYGIYILRTFQTFIGNNDVLENDEVGLLLNRGSRFNRIVANSFGWNTVNAVCTGFDNVWDDGINVGNRWSDLGENFVYTIDEDDIDRFPSLLGNGTISSTLPSLINDTNSTRISGIVTPEIAAITGFSLLGLIAVAILFGRKRK